jgi:hypothetical protein
VAFIFLLAVPSGCPKAFSSIFQQLLAKTKQFCPFSLKQPFKIFLILKIKGMKVLKTFNGSSPNT